jgi:hypothetical protein
MDLSFHPEILLLGLNLTYTAAQEWNSIYAWWFLAKRQYWEASQGIGKIATVHPQEGVLCQGKN